MTNTNSANAKNPLEASRTLIIGLVVVIVVLGFALVTLIVGESGRPGGPPAAVNVLATSDDPCVICHRQNTPGIVEQFGHSRMAAANVSCQDCHVVKADYPGATEHMGTHVLNRPTTAMCGKCHSVQVDQFNQSRHGLPAYVALVGTKGLSDELRSQYAAIPEGGFAPDKMRNALFALEGPEVTRFACEVCHDIGKPALDGSVGECDKCHLRHAFSLEQARKPETCNACHVGPDHPQWEIYHESPHGIAYATGGQAWKWDAKPGTLRVTDFPAPTCALCHMSGFGTSTTTHDVGERLTWYLFAPISERRPAWQDNKTRMQAVCHECHNAAFIKSYYEDADKLTEKINSWIEKSNQIMAPLKEKGLLTPAPFDEPIDFTYFDLWHFYGRSAKFGAWMQGPDYVQWRGAYEILHELAELREMAAEKLAGSTPASAGRGAGE